MDNYEVLFKSGPTDADVNSIKNTFAKDTGITSWEDYYWAAKCIVEYDSEDFEPKFISTMLNNSLKYGLTYRTNKEYYLDVIKMLASFYALMGRYELVLNCLNAVIELDNDVPDWVYHDLVSAQNRTRSIKKNLRKPKMFLSDLQHNDGNKASTKKKQINIYKEFLAAGIIYLSENDGAEVDIALLSKATEDYGLLNSKEWKAFLDASNGVVSKEIKSRADKIDVIEEPKVEDTPVVAPTKISRPLVISLFPEDDAEDKKLTDMEKKYQELVKRLSETQAELDEKNKKLAEAGSALDQLTEANTNLEASVKKHQADMADYEQELAEKQENISSLEKRLADSKKGSDESKELEKQIKEAIAQKEEMTSQIEAVKVALSDSQNKLKAAGEQIKKSAAENRALKEALEKANTEKQEFSSNQAAVIRGKCKTLEYITTEKLAKWLTKNLSFFNSWWEKCVISALKPEQVLKAQEGHYSTLQEFDLAALLRIFNKNWQRLCQYNFMTQSDKDTVSAMFDVRNNLAHSNVAPISKDEMIGDLAIMSDFLSVINANAESKEVAKFATEVAKMDLE